MGCFGRIRDQEKNVREEQKWDYIVRRLAPSHHLRMLC